MILKAKYLDDDIGEHDLAVPFPILKRDVPVELARFIRDKVIEDKRGGYYFESPLQGSPSFIQSLQCRFYLQDLPDPTGKSQPIAKEC